MFDPMHQTVQRDPRIEPHVGDIVSRDFKTARAGIIIREVTRSHGGFVFFVKDNGYSARPCIVTLGDWQKWAKVAEVLELGTDLRQIHREESLKCLTI